MSTNTNADLIARITKRMERAEGALKHAREAAAKLAVDGSWSDLISKANAVAHAEGKYIIFAQAVLRLQREGSQPQAVFMGLLETALMNGADDTWSGRGNEGQRSFYDGKREAVNDLRWILIEDED